MLYMRTLIFIDIPTRSQGCLYAASLRTTFVPIYVKVDGKKDKKQYASFCKMDIHCKLSVYGLTYYLRMRMPSNIFKESVCSLQLRYVMKIRWHHVKNQKENPKNQSCFGPRPTSEKRSFNPVK
jgi:hypothetical protein